MNWEAVGAIGELGGAIGVMVSLAYLAIQVKQNTRSVRGEMYDSIVTSIVDLVEPLAQDQELARIFETAVEDWEDVPFEDRSRLIYLLFSIFKEFENLHYQHTHGTLDPALWEGWNNLILSYYAMSGVRTWWQMRRGAFSADFRHYLESTPIERPLPRPSEIARGMLSPVGRLEG